MRARAWPALLPSIGGLPVGITVHHALEGPRGWRDLGLGRLQDRLPSQSGPGRERRAEIAVVRVFGRDRLALPVREPVGEGPAPRSQLPDPLARLRCLLPRCQREPGTLGAGGRPGLGRPQRREVLAGVSAAQLGVGGQLRRDCPCSSHGAWVWRSKRPCARGDKTGNQDQKQEGQWRDGSDAR